jgi:hypothetical protein
LQNLKKDTGIDDSSIDELESTTAHMLEVGEKESNPASVYSPDLSQSSPQQLLQHSPNPSPQPSLQPSPHPSPQPLQTLAELQPQQSPQPEQAPTLQHLPQPLQARANLQQPPLPPPIQQTSPLQPKKTQTLKQSTPPTKLKYAFPSSAFAKPVYIDKHGKTITPLYISNTPNPLDKIIPPPVISPPGSLEQSPVQSPVRKRGRPSQSTSKKTTTQGSYADNLGKLLLATLTNNHL